VRAETATDQDTRAETAHMRLKQIPTDADSLKVIGLASWRRGYYWPVSDAEFGGIANAVLNMVDSLLCRVGAGDANALLADVSFCSFLIQHIHAKAVAKRCEDERLELLVGRAPAGYHSPDWAAMGSGFLRLPATVERLRLKARNVAKNIVLNRKSGRYEGGGVWCVGSSGRLLRDYLVDQGIGNVGHRYAQLLVASADQVQAVQTRCSELDMAILQVLKPLCSWVADVFRVSLDEAKIAECWVRRLRRIDGIVDALADRMGDLRLLLNTEPSSPLGRIVATAALDKGAKVIAFSHGNSLGLIKNRMTAYTEMGLCNEFVCPTAGSKGFYSDIYSIAGIGVIRDVSFTSPKSNVLEELLARHSLTQKSPEGRTVMVMGAPMTSLRYILSQGDFFLSSLEMELQILEEARRCGFRTLYKVHPERIAEANGLFDGTCDAVVADPFEKAWQLADAFVFPCITSTTFAFALTTPKPVIVIDLDGQRWNPRALEHMARRCYMVKAGFGAGNKPEIDRDALRDALAGISGPSTGSFMHQLLGAESSGEPTQC
jgi:hypothetical protein